MGKCANSLADIHPELLEEWDFKRNNINPNDVKSSSKNVVWWNCKNGHNYEATIVRRAIYHSQCPYCTNQKLLYGYNDLETKSPYLAKEWDYSKNIGVTPRDIFPNSHNKYWWICPNIYPK